MSSLSPLDMKWPYWFHFYVFLLREKSSSFKLRWWGLLLKRKWIKVYNKAFTYYILFLLNCIVLLIFNKLGEALSVTRYQLGTLLHKWPKAPRSMGGWIFSQKRVELLNRVDKIKWGAETPLHTLISDEKLECLRESQHSEHVISVHMKKTNQRTKIIQHIPDPLAKSLDGLMLV